MIAANPGTAAAWPACPLVQLARIIIGNTPPTANAEYYGAGTPFVTPGDIRETKYVSTARTSLSPSGAAVARVVPAGSILYTCIGATLGKIAIARQSVAINQQLAAVIPSEERCSEFLYYMLDFLTPCVRRMAGQQTLPIVSKSQLGSLMIPLPAPGAQEAIARVLSYLDLGVETAVGLIRGKQRQQREVAFRILTGRCRFPARVDGGWRDVEIGSILREVDRPAPWDDDAEYRLVSIRRRAEGLFLRGTLPGKAILTKQLKTIRAGDFLVSRRQVVHGAWALVGPEFDGYHVSNSYTIFVPRDDSRLDIRFFGHLSRLRQMWRLAQLSSYGVHIEKLIFLPEQFYRKRVSLPASLEEQRRIADTLDLMDAEIALLRKQLEALRKQKQGLMQKLLTGEVRLKDAA
jgi:type I restriction enzyme S subunit